MNTRHRRTLAVVFAEPTPASVRWSTIEALLIAIGCEIIEGSGSRVRFVRDGMIVNFQRPHPEQEAKQYQIRAARANLTRLGVTP